MLGTNVKSLTKRNMFFTCDIVQFISVSALGLGGGGGHLYLSYKRSSRHESIAAGGVRVTGTEEGGTRISVPRICHPLTIKVVHCENGTSVNWSA
jgi:hypothetical protein